MQRRLDEHPEKLASDARRVDSNYRSPECHLLRRLCFLRIPAIS
jgi:hypothetical protein